MPMLYGSIWNQVKAQQWAEVTVSKDNLRTLIQGVRRTKCAENAGRSKLGLIPWAKMENDVELLDPERGIYKVTFRLIYDNRI